MSCCRGEVLFQLAALLYIVPTFVSTAYRLFVSTLNPKAYPGRVCTDRERLIKWPALSLMAVIFVTLKPKLQAPHQKKL